MNAVLNPIIIAQTAASTRGDDTLVECLRLIASAADPSLELKAALLRHEQHATSVMLCAREPARGILLAAIRERYAVLRSLSVALEMINDDTSFLRGG